MKEQLQKLALEGLSSYKIAKILGKSQTTIRYWLKKFNIKTNPRQAQKVSNTPNGLMKKCPQCLETKELNKEFYVRKDGRFHSWCKICNGNNVIERQRKIKQQCLEYKGNKCVYCGYNRCQAALDFHHLDPLQKDIDLSKKSLASFETLKPELDKCILLCSNCHRELHFNNKSNW